MSIRRGEDILAGQTGSADRCAGAVWDMGEPVGFTVERARCETGRGLGVGL